MAKEQIIQTGINRHPQGKLLTNIGVTLQIRGLLTKIHYDYKDMNQTINCFITVIKTKKKVCKLVVPNTTYSLISFIQSGDCYIPGYV